MVVISEVLDFIDRRFKNTDANWNNGNCYWFAKILTERFKELKIYYIPSEGHFVAGDGKYYFDYNGLITNIYKFVSLDSILQTDPLWYERLMRDCVL